MSSRELRTPVSGSAGQSEGGVFPHGQVDLHGLRVLGVWWMRCVMVSDDLCTRGPWSSSGTLGRGSECGQQLCLFAACASRACGSRRDDVTEHC